ncbi:MAG: IPT/TIG domain-containing protein, partial [Fimbriimonas ginsengisoli]|nr:IPT/TIG domain-containing protein [Fimbriimonas ginsengisoli]
MGAATVWTDIDGAGLPDIPVNAIAIDPADSTHNTLYVGTDIGAFFTSTGGTTWSPLGAAASLPNAQIQSLTLHNASRTLRAATHGRGVWDLNLGGQAALGITSIVPFTAIASPAATDITNFAVSGNGFTASSVVKFTANGITTSLTPSCPTANSCTATIPAAQLQHGALAQVPVANASLTTNAMPFTVLNPVPGITSISPTSTTAGVNGLSLTVNGGNFLSGANKTLVLFNQIPLPASAVTVQNSTTLTVQVPAGNLTTAQVVSVDTFNPQPGGGPDTNPAPPTLTITGGDFTLTPQAPTSVTVSAGSAANYTVAVGGVNGFTSSVNLSCTLPAAATYCTVTPSSAAPGISATVKVTTTARAIVPPTGFRRRLD